MNSFFRKIFRQKSKYICICVVVVFVIQTFPDEFFSRKESRNISQLVTDSLFSGVNECGTFPCLGNSLCKQFDAGTIKIAAYSGKDKYKYWTLFHGIVFDKNLPQRQKNCTIRILETENLPSGVDIMEKNESLKLFRRTICIQFGRSKYCDIRETLNKWHLIIHMKNVKGILNVDYIRSDTTSLQCASQRLVNRIVRRSPRNNGLVTMGGLTKSDKTSLLFKIKMDPGSWIQDCFPGNEGWPFGVTYGVCGRIAVHANYGTVKLSEVYLESWETRVDVACQLMDIAHQLTYNDDKYVILIHKLTIDNFRIATNRKLKIINPDDAVVIDVSKDNQGYIRHKISEDKTLKEKKANDICENVHHDINFHFMCLLLYGSESNEGILHDPHGSMAFIGRLTTLLDICAKGEILATKDEGSTRISAAKNIANMLHNIRPCSSHFDYRYPECEDVSDLNQPYNVPWQEVQ